MIANWNFTSNNEGPACLDANDRRNTLIATTCDPQKAKLAQELQDWLKRYPESVDRLLGAFVHLLHIQHINRKLIERAPDTLLKHEVQDATSRDSEFIYWLQNDDGYPRDQWGRDHEYLRDYLRFTGKQDNMGPRKFGGQLSKLARKGHIERRQKYNTKNVWDYRVASNKFPIPTEVENADPRAKMIPLLALKS